MLRPKKTKFRVAHKGYIFSNSYYSDSRDKMEFADLKKNVLKRIEHDFLYFLSIKKIYDNRGGLSCRKPIFNKSNENLELFFYNHNKNYKNLYIKCNLIKSYYDLKEVSEVAIELYNQNDEYFEILNLLIEKDLI